MSKSKVVTSIALTLVMYFMPLVFNVSLMMHFKVWILVVCSVWGLMKNPSITWDDIKKNEKHDQYSTIYIMVVIIITQIVTICEWSRSYVMPDPYLHLIDVVGLIMLFGGMSLRIWAFDILNVRKFFTSTVKIGRNWRIVKYGPYSVIRHPSYTGGLFLTIGPCVFLHTFWSFFITLCLLVGAYAFRIHLEEKLLLQHFGKKYQAYRGKTWAIIPWIW